MLLRQRVAIVPLLVDLVVKNPHFSKSRKRVRYLCLVEPMAAKSPIRASPHFKLWTLNSSVRLALIAINVSNANAGGFLINSSASLDRMSFIHVSMPAPHKKGVCRVGTQNQQRKCPCKRLKRLIDC